MTTYDFDSRISLGPKLDSFVEQQILSEPILYRCDPEFAYKHGGSITRSFLDGLERAPVLFDARVHMLSPGWYPAIPGYHHHDVPRGASGQPDYAAPTDRSQHALALVNGDVAPIDFALGKHSLSRHPEDDSGDGEHWYEAPTYKRWHDEVASQIDQGILTLTPAESNRIIYFDWQTMHQSRAAVKNGWRWIGCASYQDDLEPKNEIRSQAEVYFDIPEIWRK